MDTPHDGGDLCALLQQLKAAFTKYYTTRDIRARFGVSRITVWKWAKSPDFPQPINPGKHGIAPHLYEAADVETWAAANPRAYGPRGRLRKKAGNTPASLSLEQTSTMEGRNA